LVWYLRRRRFSRVAEQLGHAWDALAPVRLRGLLLRLSVGTTVVLLGIALTCVRPDFIEVLLRLAQCLLQAASDGLVPLTACHTLPVWRHLGAMVDPAGRRATDATRRHAEGRRP
jgi:hypothetical protein